MNIAKLRFWSVLIVGLIIWSSAMAFELSSPAFQQNSLIPQQYTCQGKNISPPLTWKNSPSDTQSFALIMNDPDAPNGNWIHWLVFNLPSNVSQLKENGILPLEAVNGLNSWSKTGYNGPCPPQGTHHYYFQLYALDTVLQLSDTAQYDDLMNAMQSHIIEKAVLQGTYRS